MTASHREACVDANKDARLDQLARIGPLFAIAYAILWVLSLDTSKAIPRDGTTLVVGRDFLNFWMTGRASWGVDPKRFYDLATYQAEVANIVGPGYLGQVWSYPPSVMLLAAPFGLLPYIPALVLWSIMGPLVAFASLRTWIADKQLLIALLLSPAAVFAMISGQFAFLATALILTVLRWRDERPWVAGLLLGLLSIKPQLGLFFPVLLLATRNWRMIAGAALSSLTIMAITAGIWGPETWLAYVARDLARSPGC